MLDRLDGDDQLLAGLVRDRPGARAVGQLLLERAGRAHPVQRLVGPVVGVDGHRAVGLDQQQPGRHGEVGGEPPDVVDGAAGDDQTHGRRRYRSRGNHPGGPVVLVAWRSLAPLRGRRVAAAARCWRAARQRGAPRLRRLRRPRRRRGGAAGRTVRARPAGRVRRWLRDAGRRLAARLPLVSVYADGRVITEGPVAAIYPGRPCPTCRCSRSTRPRCRSSSTAPWPPGVAETDDHGMPAGRRRALDPVHPRHRRGHVRPRGVRPRPRAPAGQRAPRAQQAAAARPLSDAASLQDAAGTAPRPYVPAAVAAVVEPVDRPASDRLAAPRAALARSAAARRAHGRAADFGCVTATGDAGVGRARRRGRRRTRRPRGSPPTAPAGR